MVAIVFWMSLAIILYTYIFYPLLLLVGKPKRYKYRLSLNYLPSVSVVISAYNEEKIIAEKIENLLSLDYPKEKLEIVIASDGSTDNTGDIASRFEEKGIKLIKFNSRCGKINILNKVVPEVDGEIVVLSDANTIFKKDAIKKLARSFMISSIGCVCGKLVFTCAGKNEVAKLEGFYWRYEQFLKRIEGANGALLGANGGIYAIRKTLFTPLPPDTIVEDFVIPMKILEAGYKVIYEPAAVAFEETSKKIIQEMERRIRIGAGDFQALLLTWRMLNPLRGFSAFAYISHKVIRWFVPFLLIIAFAANSVLISNKFYYAIFILQCAFYAVAIIGRILSRTDVRLRAFGLPYYFISMNIALFFGFIRFCTNSQSVTWERTER